MWNGMGLNREFSWLEDVMAKMISVGGFPTGALPGMNPGNEAGDSVRTRFKYCS
jgi:hypothetical protein